MLGRGYGAGLRAWAGRWGGVKRDFPWILWKKQLELVEAKHTMQAEALRQVR